MMFVGLDLGTTNVKALVTDSAGQTLAYGAAPIRLLPVGDGGIEQDIEEIWAAAISALQQATKDVDGSAARALGVSSQGGAMQLLDPRGRPIGRVISWLDQRGKAPGDAFTADLGRSWFLQRIGHCHAWMTIGQLLRLRTACPDLVRFPNRIGFVGDVIVERLCGRPAHDGTSCSLALLYNPALRAYDPELLQHLGIEARQLPDLISPRSAAGELLPQVAREVGLPPGLPISAAVHDQYASALGIGAVQSGVIMLGTGTAWVLLAVSDRLSEPVTDAAFACHHVVDGLYGQIVSLVNGGSALTWALDLLGMAGHKSEQIELLLETAPAGSDGVCFWPFLTPFGAAGLQPGTRGRLTGLQMSHRPAHVARAVVEGLAFELKRHLLFLERAGLPLEQLVLSGGAAGSQITPQILADVTGLPLTCSTAREGSLLGAAILARGLVEPDRSLADLAGEMVRTGRPVNPGKDAAFYAARFEDYVEALPTI